MRLFKKLLIWLAIILASLIVLVLIATTLLMNRLKPHIEQIITDNTGYETRIDGRLALKIIPGLSIVAGEVKMISHETYLFSADEIEVEVDYSEIFNQQVTLKGIRVEEPQAFISKNPEGIYNFEKLYAQLGMTPEKLEYRELLLNLETLIINNGHLLYLDMQKGDTVEVSGLDLSTEKFVYTGRISDLNPKAASFKGAMNIDFVRVNRLRVDSLSLLAEAGNGMLTIQQKPGEMLGGEVKGQASIDFNREPLSVQISHQMKDMSATLFMRMIGSDEYLEGDISYNIRLSFHSLDWQKIRETLNGEVAITGDQITFYGVDLNEALKDFKASSTVDLLKMGAVFVTGPYGPAFLNGLDYYSLLRNYEGEHTAIRQLNAEWKIADGIATAVDVAFSTPGFRLSASGSLDLKQNAFKGFTLSLVDSKGCPLLSQTLDGNFRKPESSTFAVMGMQLKSIADIRNLLLRSYAGDCSTVYSGKVKHPEG